MLRGVSVVLLALAVALGGWGATQLWADRGGDASPAAEPPAEEAQLPQEEPRIAQVAVEPLLPRVTVALGSSRDPFARGLAAGRDEVHRLFREYVLSRVVALEVDARLPRTFENWQAADDFEATEASPEGLLTCWEENWYITHEWSSFGKQILGLVPGDVIQINGRRAKVGGLFDYPKASFSNEIHELVGYDLVILQTCEPMSDLNRIVWGSWLD